MKKLTTLEVITQFKEVHGDRYGYTKFEHIGNVKKSTIICKVHGAFLQTPNAHKGGKGCPYCANEKRYEGIPTYLYHIKIGEGKDTQHKIGVCQKKRYKNATTAITKGRYGKETKDNIPFIIVNTILYEDGIKAYKKEQIIKSEYDYLTIHKNNQILYSGHTETFSVDCISKHNTKLF